MRGGLDALRAGTYWSDPLNPAPGSGVFYLVQGVSPACGAGTLGSTRGLGERVAGSAACFPE